MQLATIDGALDLGIADRTGSLTPGKRADLILVRTTDINMAPIGDPYEALVTLAQPGNVDTVVVDGRILRRKGRFTALDIDRVLRDAAETAAALQGPRRPGQKKSPGKPCRGRIKPNNSREKRRSASSTQAFSRLSAARLRSTMRRELGSSIAAAFSRWVSVRDTVSMVRPR